MFPHEMVGSAVEVLAFIVLLIFLPLILLSIRKYLARCHEQLQRQNHLLEIQTQATAEVNRWMNYFNEKLVKKEDSPPPETEVKEEKLPTPISRYKKSI